MIRYVRHNEIDRARWDECIRRSFNGIIYAYSWYLDVVCPAWEALVEENYQGVMPLPAAKKFGFHYLFPPFFIQQLGVFSVSKLTSEDVSRFLEAIPPKFRYYELNLNTFNKPVEGKWKLFPNLTHELDLIESYEKLFRGYSENTRRNVKKSQQQQLTITSDIAHEEIITLFRQARGRNVEQLREPQYDLLRTLLRVLDARGMLHVRGVKGPGGDLQAGAFFTDSNGKVIFLFSGTSVAARESGAMFFLVDHFISENAQKNLVLDFEGSNDENLARFYKGFGAKEYVYLQARKNELPWPVKLLKKRP
ncbi:MAG: hypothetical protein FD123_913 [Bacteroidetes bacterium]|nr:MAG: hypothetical protein FD123_913 [Bacteroidota bacterium]